MSADGQPYASRFKIGSDGVFWHWTGSPGVAFENGKFTPCDFFDNGNLQYADESFEDLESACKFSLNYFT